MNRHGLCVYEAVNSAAREAVVGATYTNRIEALRALHKLAPPVWVARWRPDQPITYSIVEGFSSLEAAQEFAEGYRRSGALRRLTVHVAGMTAVEA